MSDWCVCPVGSGTPAQQSDWGWTDPFQTRFFLLMSHLCEVEIELPLVGLKAQKTF